MSNKKNVKENQLRLPNGKIITFNDEQFSAVNKINEWLKSDKTFFTLSGYAGTGKSTCVKKILDNYYGGVVVSAPTHKAKKVIIKTTGKEGKTLHSLLGLRPDIDLDNFDPNRPQFNPIAIPQITDYNLVIIDEASMINQGLFNLIKENLLFSRTKVLFIGDPAQIPPVGEKESVVFYQDDIEKVQLTKIERQNDTNPLMFIHEALRNNLTSIDGCFERKTIMNEYGEGAKFTLNKKEFRDLILEKYSSDEFKKDTDFSKVIAWRNNTVNASNKIIRNELFEDSNDSIVIGDLLMGYRTITNERRLNIIENSADYRVVDRSDLDINSYGISGYWTKIREDIDKGTFRYKDVFIVDCNNEENLNEYGKIHDFLCEIAKSDRKQWKKYYEFRRNNLILKNIYKYSNGTDRNSSDVIVKDLDYGYAITGHKSQGSTYSHVFVMENDINCNMLIKERNQIKYVAFTRPSISATILTTKID